MSTHTLLGLALSLLGLAVLFVRLSTRYKVILGSVLLIAGAILLLPGRHQVEAITAGDSKSSTKSLMLYCAAGIRDPIEKARKDYEKEYGVEIQVQYGGSGALLNNLKVAQKGDLYLSADANLMAKARAEGLVAEILPLAKQHPVIVTAHGNPRQITSLNDVTRDGLKWCYANPDAAAVGTVTKRVLQKMDLWEKASKQATVFKPTVNDVASDVKLGSVDAGIVWSTTAIAYPELAVVQAPELENQVEEIKLGVLKSSQQTSRALHFARFLAASDRGLVHFNQLGYEASEGDAWSENPELIIYSGALNRMSLQPVMTEFEKREGVRIKSIFNGCGILAAQMKIDLGKTSFPDVYFACDGAYLDPVQEFFEPRTIVSETDIVMLVAKGNPKGIHGAQDLKQEGLKVGVGNMEQCTLGLLTKRFLMAADGLYDRVKPNIRSEQPTADLLVNQMLTNSLDAVIVYRVNAEQVKDKLDIVPTGEKGSIAVQPITVSKVSTKKQMARRFIELLLSPSSRTRMEALAFRWRAGTPTQ